MYPKKKSLDDPVCAFQNVYVLIDIISYALCLGSPKKRLVRKDAAN